jgi:oxaloacetate decarboxylase alpha subunit
MADVTFVDTTLRDGQQSLWALGMRTDVMLPALPAMDQANFDSMEFWMPAVQIRKMARDLNENPLRWLRLGTQRARATPLRLIGGITSGLGDLSASLGRLLIEQAVAHGIRITRFSDPWNDFEALAPQVEELRAMGVRSVVNLIYSVSPKHTDEYYAQRARAAAALKPYRICFKDVGGLLTPERTRQLVPLIAANVGDVPLEFHAHCNNGLAPLCYLEAVEQGITCLHTAVPPLANGSSNPSIFSVAKNLRARGHDPQVDERVLSAVSKHLAFAARRDGLPMGAPAEFDADLYRHQVPGGMISNLRYQLARMGAEGKLAETLDEAARVRADFGFPIMVTPLSQFVGSQAALNVVTGRRYDVVTDEVILYALGRFGRQAVESMDPEVREAILSRARAEELAQSQPPDPTIEELRQRLGGSVSDEELILRMCAGEAGRLVAREPSSAPSDDRLLGQHPLMDLAQGLLASTHYGRIVVQKGDFSMTLRR